MIKTPENFYDVVIVGGGLAGLTSAIHLSKFGVNALVIEKIAIQNTKFVANIFQTKFYLT